MAIYLPGPPIKFPPPPGVSDPGVIGEPSVKYSAAQTKQVINNPVCKLVTLINTSGKEVEFSLELIRDIVIGKKKYSSGKIIKYKVKEKSTKAIAFWTTGTSNNKMLQVSDNAGKRDVYWSLYNCTFDKTIFHLES